MKRLTDKRLALPPGVWQKVTREQRMEMQEIPVPSKQELYYRLFEIEEILCDGENEYDLDRLAVMCNQRMSMRDEVSERFSLTANIPLGRLKEIAEAEREGRCVIAPFKVGQTVYLASKTFGVEEETVTRNIAESETWSASVETGDIGSTAFLTREEAEATLAKLNSET